MEGFSKLSPVVNMGWILKWSSMTWMIWGTSILGSPPQMPMKWDRIVQDSLLYRTVVASGSVALGSDSNSTQQCWEKGKPSGNNPIYFRSVFHGENDLNWKCWVRKRLWRISTPKLPEKKPWMEMCQTYSTTKMHCFLVCYKEMQWDATTYM